MVEFDCTRCLLVIKHLSFRDTLHLTEIVIRQPFILVNFLRGLSLWSGKLSVQAPQSNSCAFRELFWVMRIKPAPPLSQKHEVNSWRSYKLVSLPTESSLLYHVRNANVFWHIQMNSSSITKNAYYNGVDWACLTVRLSCRESIHIRIFIINLEMNVTQICCRRYVFVKLSHSIMLQCHCIV